MANIGLVPGQDFDPSKLGAFDKEALKVVPKTLSSKSWSTSKKLVKTPMDGQSSLRPVSTGRIIFSEPSLPPSGWAPTGHRMRSIPTSQKDGSGKEYDGASNKYVMHIDKGQFPPVNGFWSLTMYDATYFFVPNSLNRYTLSQRNKFVTNPDGSVDLYLQADSPGKAKEANWLPAPKAKFIPMMRLYWPKETPPSIIDGSWNPPAIKQMQ